MRVMRKLAPAFLLVVAGCVATSGPPPDPSSTPGVHGLTIEEEATILALEDRREHDPAITAAWVAHPNALHRQRIALALGRIGPHTFVDENGDDDYDAGFEYRAGVRELIALSTDPDRKVRETVAFALGEIGDRLATDTLFLLAQDADGAVAGEAVEALSKLTNDPGWVSTYQQRFIWLTLEPWPEGVRAHALRFLFRFDTDIVSKAAMDALSSPSPILRQEATYSLSRRGYEPARPQLELLLSDPNVLTRMYAAAALGRIADAASMPALVAALGDVHPWIRTNAAVALSRVLEKDPRLARPDDLPRIMAAADDPDPGVRAVMIDVLALYGKTLGGARTRFVRSLRNGTLSERELAAASTVRRFRPENLERWKFEPFPTAIVRALEYSGPWKEWRSQFYTHENPAIRAAAIRAIPRGNEEAEGEVIAAALDDEDVIVRATAIEKYVEAAMSWKEAASVDPDAPRPRARTTGVPRIPLPRSITDPVAGMPGSEPKPRPAPVVTAPKPLPKRVTIEDIRAAIAEAKEGLNARITLLQGMEERERSSELNDARLAAIRAVVKLQDLPGRRAYLRGLLTDRDPVVRRVAADLFVEEIGADRPRYTPLPVERPGSEYEEIVRWSREPHTATIHLPRGNIELVLLAQNAPMTAWNFAQLATKKFYDDTSFMRVVPNFVIQGGDPRNDQNGGPGYAIVDEINLQKYTRGAVGMALSGPDTGGSQFFIAHSPQPHLDGGYTIFARVYDGMTSVVDQVERGDRVTTITIDEKAAPGQQEASIANVSLPLFIGDVTSDRLLEAVPGYAEAMSQYAPDATVLEMMKMYVKPNDRIEVYMGTWCDDSQREVPKLLRIVTDLATSHDVKIPLTITAVDRGKQMPAKALAGKDLQRVATVIYYRGKRELGRIVEQPVSLMEDDLLALAATE